MSHWPFILAAYGVTAALVLPLLGLSWAAMRRAEGEAERLGRER